MNENNSTNKQIGFEMSYSYKNIISTVSIKPFYINRNENCILFLGNCLDIMDSIPTDSINMIFAAPPYFFSNGAMSCHAGKKLFK
ncbi:MAG: hypothetical protein ABSE81_06810 [Candidatus Omnitrophota bacterium]|jgi:site-specific DNA-methyltransferase (adenine-specific)